MKLVQVAEVLRITALAATAATVYVSAIRTVIGYVRGRPRRIGWKPTAALVLAFSGLVCGAYAYFVEPHWLATSHVSITASDLPPGTPPIRIAHISDIHSEAQPILEEQLADAVQKEKPDLIVFTGDAINTLDGLPIFKALMTKLTRIAPVYAVRGNWDTVTFAGVDLYKNTGVQVLHESTAKLAVRGTPVWIAGMDLGANRDKAGTFRMERVIQSVPSDEFLIFLYHSPDFIETAVANSVDLYCAGHTHGGQVALPFYGALVTASIYGKSFEAGLHHVRDTYLYVNRGLGATGGYMPRVRFLVRPELTIIDVVSNLTAPAGPHRSL
jgi:uncharacterized protein